jgi:protein-S-isoprenylcysteine O-methyltransferase Ste14
MQFKYVAALTYAALSYVVFLLSFVYAIGFVGNLLVPKSLDSGTLGSIPAAVDSALLLLFAVPHSVMARPEFKRWWTRFVPSPLERSTYVLVSSVCLSLVFWQWQPLPSIVWQVANPVGSGVLWTVFWTGWAIVLVSTFLIDHFDLFGLRQVYLYAAGRPYTPVRFKTTALYRFVRHPIMLGFLLAFWATPSMTVGHLLFAALSSAYIVVGVSLEERDLRKALGEPYRLYCERVPMLLPVPKSRAALPEKPC